MPTIGVRAVTGFQGRMAYSRKRVSIIDAQPGVAGSVAVLGAWRSDVSPITTRVVVPHLTAVAPLVTAYRALSGTSTFVFDQFEVFWPNVFVADVVVEYDQLVTGPYRVTARWALVPDSSDPTA